MKSYNVNHITNSHMIYIQKRFAEKYGQILKSLLYKAKEEGKDLY